MITLLRASYSGHKADVITGKSVIDVLKQFCVKVDTDEDYYVTDHYVKVSGHERFIGKSHKRTGRAVTDEIMMQLDEYDTKIKFRAFYEPDHDDIVDRALGSDLEEISNDADEEIDADDTW